MNLLGWLKGRSPRNNAAPGVDASAADAADASPETVDPAEGRFQWWRDAVNRGDHFRLDPDNCTFGRPFGETYMYVRLIDASSPEEGTPFAEIAEFLLSAGMGAVLCLEAGAVAGGGPSDHLEVTYGDVVDFLLHGDLAVRDGKALGWDMPVDQDGLQILQPGDDILLPKQRQTIHHALYSRGVLHPKVALVVDRLGKRALVFNIMSSGTEQASLPLIGGFVNCCLPSHYRMVGFLNDAEIAIFPLWPVHADVRAQQCRTMFGDPATRFQVHEGELVRESDGTIFTKVRVLTPASKQEGITLDALALRIADAASGAIFYDEADEDSDDNGGELTVFLGEMVDYLMTGRLGGHPSGHDGWGLGEDLSAGAFTNPDIQVLPLQSRLGILAVMESCGSSELTVALNVSPEGLRSLHFGGWEDVYAYRGQRGVQVLGDAIRYCLPDHYAVVMNEPTLMSGALTPRWAIWPWESRDDREETEEPE